MLSGKALVVYADLETAKTGRAAVERLLSAVSGKSPGLSFDPVKAGRRNGVSLAAFLRCGLSGLSDAGR